MSEKAKTVESEEVDPLNITGCGMSVVLNGGSSVMESGTIPIQFVWDEKTVSGNFLPTHVLVIDFNEDNIALLEKDDCVVKDKGERSLHRVSDGLAFMQFNRPGKHALIFIAFNSSSKEEMSNLKELLKMQKNGSNRYIEDVSFDVITLCAKRFIDKLTLYLPRIYGLDVVAVHSVTIDVPQELFAQKPRGKIGEFFWEGAKLWLRREPRDECEFRKMVLLSPFWISASILIGIVGIGFIILFGLIALLGRCAVAFCGYRPAQFSLILEFFQADMRVENSIMKFRRYKDHLKPYRLWKTYNGEDNIGSYAGDKYLWITPLEIVGCAVVALFFGLLIYKANKEIAVMTTYWTFGITALFLVFSRVFKFADKLDRWMRKMAERANGKRVSAKPVVPDAGDFNASYRKWLLESSGMGLKRINLSHPLIPFRRKVFNRARVVFMAAKIKVCKPFAK